MNLAASPTFVLDTSGMNDSSGRVAEEGVPDAALWFFARWWRLENYLRDLVYTELRAHDGLSYENGLSLQARHRAEQDRVNEYIASADADEALAYLDAGQLLDLISARWELFEKTLLPRQRWDSRLEELRSLRNRISHCRRPHSTDLPRLDMLLGDLELGAQRFFSSYNDSSCEFSSKDPFAQAWIAGRHSRADLIEHARNKYWTRMHVRLSRRPWASECDGGTVSGEPGYLWHVDWAMDSRRISPRRLWESLDGAPKTQEQLVHLLFPNPYRVSATFTSVDDPDLNADAVARVFEAICEEGEWFETRDLETSMEWTQWRAEGCDLPRKVQVESTLAVFDPWNPTRVFESR